MLREYIVLIEPNRYNPLMFIFALLVKAERGVLFSGINKWRNTLKSLDVEIVAGMVTGMITQENTPAFMSQS